MEGLRVLSKTGASVKILKDIICIRLLGSFPGHEFNQQALFEKFLFGKKFNKKILILWDSEPDILYTADVDLMSLVHKICDQIKYPCNNVYFFTCNHSIHESYKSYCNIHNINVPINIEYSYIYFRRTFEDSKHLDLSIEKKDKFFTCINGEDRLPKVLFESVLKEHGVYKKENTLITFNNSFDNVVTKVLKLASTDAFINAYSTCCFNVVIDCMQNEYHEMKIFSKKNPWYKQRVVSEKVIRNFVWRIPFILFADKHILKWLHMQGFKTFDCIFDESYDDIDDDHERATAIVQQLKYICNTYTVEEFSKIVQSQQVLDIHEHNYQLLKNMQSQLKNTEMLDDNLINSILHT